jgi:hypothetical protein
MADFKGNMFRHLRSAKVWLTRAEESFDKNSKIRGELDLLLAQAELQHARETGLSRHERYSMPFVRQATSFVLAAAIVAAGFGAYWGFSERHAAVPIPLAAQEAKATPVVLKAVEPAAAPVRVENQRPAIASPTSNPPQEAIMPAKRSENNGQQRPAEKESLLSPDEMKDIIRAAGKSLRGQ